MATQIENTNFYFLLVGPLFFALMYWEAKRGAKTGRVHYDRSDLLTNLNLAIGQQMFELISTIPIALGYVAIQTRFALFHIEPKPLNFILAFVILDFCIYWFHRSCHRISFLWAIHEVHHSSTHYNFSTALRQEWFHKWIAFPVYFFGAFLGFPILVFLGAGVLHASIQIWVHTELLPYKKTWLRYFLVLPSHHRVHHATNPKYIDRNFSAVISFWDYIFGTAEEESEKPIYGILDPIQSSDPWVINTRTWKKLARAASELPTLTEKLAIWFKPPEKALSNQKIPPIEMTNEPKRNPHSWPKTLTLFTALLVYYFAFQIVAPSMVIEVKMLGVIFGMVLAVLFGRVLNSSSVARRKISHGWAWLELSSKQRPTK